MTKVMSIRKEFGEPFRDVIAGFALMGYSKSATAEILEINRSYFYQHLLPRYAPGIEWPEQRDMRPECKGRGRGWPKGKSRTVPQKYTDAELLRMVSKHEKMQEFREYEIPHVDTVIKRFGSWRRARALAKEAV